MQMPIFIHDVAGAFAVIIQLRIPHVSILSTALSMEIIALDLHVVAGLQIRTCGARDASSGRAVAAYHATQRAIVVVDAAGAVLETGQARAVPGSACILAVGYKRVTAYGDVVARLLICSLWNPLRHCGCAPQQSH
jgi:hypothetical protein